MSCVKFKIHIQNNTKIVQLNAVFVRFFFFFFVLRFQIERILINMRDPYIINSSSIAPLKNFNKLLPKGSN